jgi:hypothetical protein
LTTERIPLPIKQSLTIMLEWRIFRYDAKQVWVAVERVDVRGAAELPSLAL